MTNSQLRPTAQANHGLLVLLCSSDAECDGGIIDFCVRIQRYVRDDPQATVPGGLERVVQSMQHRISHDASKRRAGYDHVQEVIDYGTRWVWARWIVAPDIRRKR